jgi:hypothetical protein
MFTYWPGSSTPSPRLGRPGVLGQPCTSSNAGGNNPGSKSYQYRVQSGDGMYSIAQKFRSSVAPSENPTTGWGQLVTVNPQIPTHLLNGVCVLDINAGDLINIPLSWPDPGDLTPLVCPTGGSPPNCASAPNACAAGEYPSDGAGGACRPPPFPVPVPPGTCPSPLFKDGNQCVASCPPGKKPDANGNCVSAVTTAGVSGGGAAFAVILAVAAAVLALGSEQKTGRGARRTRGMGASIR